MSKKKLVSRSKWLGAATLFGTNWPPVAFIRDGMGLARHAFRFCFLSDSSRAYISKESAMSVKTNCLKKSFIIASALAVFVLPNISSADAARRCGWNNCAYHGGGRNNNNWSHHHNGGNGSPWAYGALGFGLGMLAVPGIYGGYGGYGYRPAYASGAAWYRYCAARYRSFDPASGTYMGYDGHRHRCR